MQRPDALRRIVGWDIGGAHVKACLLEDGAVRDIAQWPCPLWQGLAQLETTIAVARARWPQGWDAHTVHVATMTGEMVDLFADREDGVRRLTAALAEALGPSLRLFAGQPAGGPAWVAPPDVAQHWAAIASANWCATAARVAARVTDAVLVDIGSTTTDLIALRGGHVATHGNTDAQRLASGALVYQGVVRTPLCALARRVPFGGEQVNVMNEFFATTADVYRLSGELAAAHDQHPSADQAAKDPAATRQRLARMIGRDAGDAPADAWLALARFWRGEQLGEIAGQLARVIRASGVPRDAPLVAAGCGDFLVAELAAQTGRPLLRFAGDVVALPDISATSDLSGWAQVCAPAVAVALLASSAEA